MSELLWYTEISDGLVRSEYQVDLIHKTAYPPLKHVPGRLQETFHSPHCEKYIHERGPGLLEVLFSRPEMNVVTPAINVSPLNSLGDKEIPWWQGPSSST